MTLRFAANLSILWPGLPLGERFERAARAGFSAVELWWPGDDEAARLPGLTRRWGLHLALLNFDGGDLPGGDRGLAADPDRAGRLRANVPRALHIAADCGCRRLNLLVGQRLTGVTRWMCSWTWPATTSPGPRTWPPTPAAR